MTINNLENPGPHMDDRGEEGVGGSVLEAVDRLRTSI